MARGLQRAEQPKPLNKSGEDAVTTVWFAHSVMHERSGARGGREKKDRPPAALEGLPLRFAGMKMRPALCPSSTAQCRRPQNFNVLLTAHRGSATTSLVCCSVMHRRSGGERPRVRGRTEIFKQKKTARPAAWEGLLVPSHGADWCGGVLRPRGADSE